MVKKLYSVNEINTFTIHILAKVAFFTIRCSKICTLRYYFSPPSTTRSATERR